jgi:hypothetical protein
MDSIEARAYKLFEATFRAKSKNKLQDSKLLESLNIEVVENGNVTLNIYI